jgi:hypothetical protein
LVVVLLRRRRRRSTGRAGRGLVWAGAGVLDVAGAVAAVVGFAAAGRGETPPPCAPEVAELTIAPTVPAATCLRGETTVRYSLTPAP